MIIQILSHNGDLYGLTNKGNIYVRTEWEHGFKWVPVCTDDFDMFQEDLE